MSDDDFKSKMLASQAEIHSQLMRLNTAVLGDEEAEIKGLAQRTKANEDYIEKDKAFKNKVAGGLFLAVPLFGMVVEWVKKHWPF